MWVAMVQKRQAHSFQYSELAREIDVTLIELQILLITAAKAPPPSNNHHNCDADGTSEQFWDSHFSGRISRTDRTT